MSEPKFSRGPWEIGNSHGTQIIRASDGNAIMCDLTYYPFVTNVEADWHLIAAAPDLYEFIERMADRYFFDDSEYGVEAARLLAKARGEA